MNNPLILHMDTSTDICSVALSEGERVLAVVESGPERSHATLLSMFIRQALKQSSKVLGDLDAIAISKGPGSYTGLRIGVSTAKGLAYGLDKPLLSCGTLENMSRAARSSESFATLPAHKKDKILLCPMLDARRMEVYTAFFDLNFTLIREVSAEIIDPESFSRELEEQCIVFFGNGSDKCKEVIDHPNAIFLDNIHPGAEAMVPMVLARYEQKLFEDVAYFEPFYLKDFVATIPRKKVL